MQAVKSTENLSLNDNWSNLAKVVYRRTYSRKINGVSENWEQTVKRVIDGNIKKYKDTEFLDVNEEERLFYYMFNRKAMPAGRGLWFSGTEAQEKLGGLGLNNCAFITSENYENFVLAQDYLMLGSGVGMSIEHRFVSKLPRIKKNVSIKHKNTKDADFIVPDSREGWCELTRKVLKSFFETGRSFNYSTICIRGAGEEIVGFGGKASGPAPVVAYIEKLTEILEGREGKHIRPIDALDIICAIGEMVVSGNVRRSAIIILGDPWDKEYLKAKRWDLEQLPTQRAMANLSVICDNVEDLHPLFWKTYEHGEPYGIVNRKTIQTFGRIGERKSDSAVGINPCGELPLENGEVCNLQEIFLPNLKDVEEFKEAARLMHRWGKRVTNEKYHQDITDTVVKRNRRIGTGITGCLQSSLFEETILDEVYEVLEKENISYSKQLGVKESIRLTTVKPSGTMSLLGDTTPGIHPSFSKYYIRRVRFAANDELIPVLKEAGHFIEPVKKFDGSLDMGTFVVNFYCRTPDNTPCADEGWDTFKQLEVLKKAQKHWSDNAVSVTVYYKKEEIPEIKEWLSDNLKELKSISFLCHNDHGFDQAPYEAISEEEYNKSIKQIKPIRFEDIGEGELESLECSSGVCPIR